MTYQELFKLHELKGRLQGRRICLEADIASTRCLVATLITESYQAHHAGQLEVMEQWHRDNARLLEEVGRIIREAENARE